MGKDINAQCHILDKYGRETIELINLNDVSFDISKYTDKNGELYAIESEVEGKQNRTLVSKKVYKNKKTEIYKSAGKNDRLGAFHIIIAYILIPLMTMLYILSGILSIVYLIEMSGKIIYTADIITSFLVVFTGINAIIYAIRKDSLAPEIICSHFIMLLLSSVQTCIQDFILHESLVKMMPTEIIMPLILLLCSKKYYSKRDESFTSTRYKKKETTLAVIGCATFIYDIIIYIYSVACMFEASTSFGWLGIGAPIIGQLVYIFISGLDSVLAYLIYYCFALSIFSCIAVTWLDE